jgi:outer membrane usher protein
VSAAANITQISTDLTVSHRLQTSTNVLQTFLDWQGTGGTMTVNPAGGIVWVAGHGFFLTRPLTDAFALVRVPDVKDVRVYVNSQEVGRTNARGDFLVPTMISYYGSQLKIASQDVPINYALDRDSLVIAAPRRGAALAEFRATRTHYFRGHVVVVRNGKEDVPSYGDLVVKDHGMENISPLGEDGSFEFEGLAAGLHDAEIRHKRGLCKFRFDAKELSDASLIDLGLLRCTVGGASTAP